MKFCEILTEEQLEEVHWGRVIGTGALAAAAAAGSYQGIKSHFSKHDKPAQTAPAPQATIPEPPTPVKSDDANALAGKILKKYKKLDPDLALKVATLAKKYEKPAFPKADDILSIVGIESAFNPNAVSQLKHDPAIGLTQIRPGAHKMDAKKLSKDIEQQIQKSSDILDQYNKGLNDPEAAVIAYNVGYGDYRKGKYNQDYLNKFNKEKQLYK
jgi:soluble lytic murein transglycosylase-like protein